MAAEAITLRAATTADLDVLNRVVEQAVMGWDLPERVKRLVLPTYRYNAFDLAHQRVLLAVAADGGILGVAAWEPAPAADMPAGHSGLLLHGIYVAPAAQRGGIGSRLLAEVEHAARTQGIDGVLVKAQRGAEGFFLRQGYAPLPVQDPERDYPHRCWKELWI